MNTEGYVMPLDKGRLKGAPRYPQDDVPDYTQQYGRQIHGYYGIGWYRGPRPVHS